MFNSLTGGKSESNANLAEGLATSLVCFDDLEEKRENLFATQKHCILICNSAPYLLHVTECNMYENKNVDQLLQIYQEVIVVGQNNSLIILLIINIFFRKI